MGYYSDFEVLASGNFVFTEEMLEKYFYNGALGLYDNGIRGKTKWYECEEDMKKFSADFPDTLFTMSVSGENPGDLWRAYFKKGKVQRVDAVITYPEFNESELE